MANDLSEEDRNKLSQKAAKMAVFLKSPAPDDVLKQYQKDYKWLSQVYTSVKPGSDDNGRLLWHALGAQTTALIHAHIHVQGINQEMEEVVLDADIIDNLMNSKNPKDADKVIKILTGRLGKQKGNLLFKKLSERLEALRDKAEKGLINSIEFRLFSLSSG